MGALKKQILHFLQACYIISLVDVFSNVLVVYYMKMKGSQDYALVNFRFRKWCPDKKTFDNFLQTCCVNFPFICLSLVLIKAENLLEVLIK